jgi:hypothetical protein
MFATDVTQMEEEGETKVMMWRKKGRKWKTALEIIMGFANIKLSVYCHVSYYLEREKIFINGEWIKVWTLNVLASC